MWFSEQLYDDCAATLQGKQLYKKKSSFQDVQIYETPRLGRILVLDNVIHATTKDGFISPEMLTHPLLLTHSKPENVLVIGVGAGGTLREVLKHKNIKKVVAVEIDKEVIDASKKYLSSINAGAFHDPRVQLLIEDGAKYAGQTAEKFDIVVIDSAVPIGPAKALFTEKFYQDISRLLTDRGLMICQTGSGFYQPDEIAKSYAALSKIFPIVTAQLAAVPACAGGFSTFLIVSKYVDPLEVSYDTINERYERIELETDYYNPAIHYSSLALPNYIRRKLR